MHRLCLVPGRLWFLGNIYGIVERTEGCFRLLLLPYLNTEWLLARVWTFLFPATLPNILHFDRCSTFHKSCTKILYLVNNMDQAQTSTNLKTLANTSSHLEHGASKTAPHDESVPEILRQYSSDELDAMEKSIVRRIDFRTLPILVILFILNILDRNTIANARLGGLEAELGMSDAQYQTALMVLWGELGCVLMGLRAR